MWPTVGHLSHAAITVPAARLKCRGAVVENCNLRECYMYFSPAVRSGRAS